MAFLPEQGGDGERVIARGHQSGRAFEKIGKRAAFVDGKVVNDRFHREGQGMLQFLLGGGHDFLEALLGEALFLRSEDEAHAAAGHAAQHPEAPESLAEFGAHAFDESLGESGWWPRG